MTFEEVVMMGITSLLVIACLGVMAVLAVVALVLFWWGTREPRD